MAVVARYQPVVELCGGPMRKFSPAVELMYEIPMISVHRSHGRRPEYANTPGLFAGLLCLLGRIGWLDPGVTSRLRAVSALAVRSRGRVSHYGDRAECLAVPSEDPKNVNQSRHHCGMQ
jgi:hypothetical protein